MNNHLDATKTALQLERTLSISHKQFHTKAAVVNKQKPIAIKLPINQSLSLFLPPFVQQVVTHCDYLPTKNKTTFYGSHP